MFTEINRDTNGNPRYVCHYVNLLTPEDQLVPYDQQYACAIYNAKALGGKKFHNKQYGGGIVFTTYNIRALENSIHAIAGTPIKPERKWPRDVDSEESE